MLNKLTLFFWRFKEKSAMLYLYLDAVPSMYSITECDFCHFTGKTCLIYFCIWKVWKSLNIYSSVMNVCRYCVGKNEYFCLSFQDRKAFVNPLSVMNWGVWGNDVQLYYNEQCWVTSLFKVTCYTTRLLPSKSNFLSDNITYWEK